MDPDGVWVMARGDGEFRRAGGRWVHGPDAGAWREFPVPGARDVTLDELHGHRILDPRLDATLDRHYWQLHGDVLHIRLRDAQQFSELSWARTPYRQRHPTLGTLCAFSATRRMVQRALGMELEGRTTVEGPWRIERPGSTYARSALPHPAHDEHDVGAPAGSRGGGQPH